MIRSHLTTEYRQREILFRSLKSYDLDGKVKLMS